MEYPTQLEIDTPDGVARLEKIYCTELGHVMAKVYYTKEKKSIHYRLGDISEMLTIDFSNLRFSSYKESIYKKLTSNSSSIK